LKIRKYNNRNLKILYIGNILNDSSENTVSLLSNDTTIDAQTISRRAPYLLDVMLAD